MKPQKLSHVLYVNGYDSDLLVDDMQPRHCFHLVSTELITPVFIKQGGPVTGPSVSDFGPSHWARIDAINLTGQFAVVS